MGKVLFVSAAVSGEDALKGVLRQAGLALIDQAQSAGEARRKLNVGAYGIVLINMPLSDETGRDLAVYAAEKTDAAVMVLIKAGWEESVASIGRENGVYIISKPLNRQFFLQSLQFIAHAQKRIGHLKESNEELSRMLRDEKMAGRAKCYLVRHEGMTEAMAHHYLEATAMEKHMKKNQIVEMVIDRFSGREEEQK